MKDIPIVHFEAPLVSVKDWVIVRLPEQASKAMPSRGQVAVVATIGGHKLHMVLEPDGYWGHWVRISDELQKMLGVKIGDTIAVELLVTKDWPEPTIPSDFEKALEVAPQKVKDKWKDITPMARWEWIRWVNSTGNNETRAIRIEKSISKLNGKHRRPCCFNLAACTEPHVAKSGRLMGVA